MSLMCTEHEDTQDIGIGPFSFSTSDCASRIKHRTRSYIRTLSCSVSNLRSTWLLHQIYYCLIKLQMTDVGNISRRYVLQFANKWPLTLNTATGCPLHASSMTSKLLDLTTMSRPETTDHFSCCLPYVSIFS